MNGTRVCYVSKTI